MGGFGAEPGHIQQGFGEGSREGLEGFGAEPSSVHQEKVSEKVSGGFGAESGQVKRVLESWRRFRRRSGRLGCRGSPGFTAAR